ncbi:oxaloacetate decarboxylase [Lachnospiraceae bacterium]|nr:oxaloacetate decarboxylase [Lachnospiraceae bacterium]
MKKIVGIILAVLGTVTAVINLVFKVNGQTSVARSVSVIGGADGPTSIFLAGKVEGSSAVAGMIVGILLLIVGIFMIVRKK